MPRFQKQALEFVQERLLIFQTLSQCYMSDQNVVMCDMTIGVNAHYDFVGNSLFVDQHKRIENEVTNLFLFCPIFQLVKHGFLISRLVS